MRFLLCLLLSFSLGHPSFAQSGFTNGAGYTNGLKTGSGGGGSGTVASGTTNQLAKYTGSTSVGSGIVTDTGTNVGISSTSPGQTLDIQGTMRSLAVITNAISGSSTGPVNFPITTGNVGIASTSPGQALDVQGTVRSIDIITLQPSADVRYYAQTLGGMPGTFSDAIPALNACYAANANPGTTGTASTCYLGPGQWYFASKLVMPPTNYNNNFVQGAKLLIDNYATIQTSGNFSAVEIQNGDQVDGGAFNCSANTSAACVQISDPSGSINIGTYIKNTVLYRNFSGAVGTGIGIEADSPSSSNGVIFVDVENVQVYGFAKSFYVNSGSGGFVNSNNFTDDTFWNFQYALYCDGPGQCNNNSFKGMHYQSATSGVTAVIHWSGNSNKFDSDFEDVPTNAWNYVFTATSEYNTAFDNYPLVNGALGGEGISDAGLCNSIDGYNLCHNVLIGIGYTAQTVSNASNSLIVQGDIGIGTLNPAQVLDIQGTTRALGYTQTGTSANTFTGTPTFSNATYSGLFTGGNVGIGSATPGQALDVQGTVRTTGFTLSGNNAASGFILQTSGNLGIGTWVAEPAGSMVYPGAGIANSTGSAWGTSYTTTGSSTVVALQTSPSFSTNITVPLINGSSSVTQNLQLKSTTGTGTTDSISLTVGTNGGTTGLIVKDNSGIANVGIGSATPGQALDVQGTIRASGFSGQSSGTILCVKTGGGIGYCSGVVAGISCTCN